MRLVGHYASGQFIKATNAAEKVMAKGITISMREGAKVAVQKGRDAITAAGFSTNAARTLVALNKPKTGYVLDPTVWIHSTVNYFDVFEKGATITGSIGGRSASPYLWLPTPNAPPNPGSGIKFGGFVRRDHMTPSQYVRKVGPLITIRRKGKLPVLAAVVEGPETKPSVKRLRRTAQRPFFRALRGGKKKETHIVIMYVAVSSITIPPKFNATAAVENALEGFQIIVDKNIPDQEIP